MSASLRCLLIVQYRSGQTDRHVPLEKLCWSLLVADLPTEEHIPRSTPRCARPADMSAGAFYSPTRRSAQ